MSHFLISILFLLTGFYQQIDIVALKKDPIMIQYKKVYNELKAAPVSGKYKLPKDPNLQKELAANPTKEGMTRILKEKGMINAEEYVDKIILQTSLMFEFLKKHPELSKLNQQKKVEIFSKLLED